MRNSRRYQFNINDFKSIGKVLAFSVGSTLVATLLTLLPQITIPTEYAMIGGIVVNVVNTLLVAAKNWLANNTPA